MITIDPGVHKSAFAWWTSLGQLSTVAYYKLEDPSVGLMVGRPIIEVPQVYQGRAQKGDPNDLITLAVEVGRIGACFIGGFELIRPRTWKGTVKKEIMTKRILSKLTPTEMDVLGVLRQNHNVVDAVGIGLWKLGRL